MDTVFNVTIDLVDDADRLRPVDMKWAKVLAEAMSQQGQLTPIEVRQPEGGRYPLVFGAHRLAAARLLGWDTLRAQMFNGDADEARMREIDENLCRHDLNDLDRAIFLGERKRLYEALHPTPKEGKGKGKQDVARMATILRFTLETSRQTKMAERTIQRLCSRYDNLTPAVRDRLRGTWLASVGAELDALARLSPAEQARAVDMLLREDDPQPNVKAALTVIRGIKAKPKATADDEFSRLLAVWKVTGADARAMFRDFVAKAVKTKAGA